MNFKMWVITINLIGVIFSFLGIVLNIIHENFKWAIVLALCFGLNMMFLVTNINKLHNQNDNIEISQPTAKDVYDGKTTLRIVYEDSIPVDTIVVFKKEFR